MRRRDLDKTGHYDGWQAVDSTPQEASDGRFNYLPDNKIVDWCKLKQIYCRQHFKVHLE